MNVTSAAASAASAVATVAPIDSLLAVFNTNPYFIGLMMLILNLGGRFIALEVTKEQERFFQHPMVRRFLIFVVLFVATRNIWVAFWSTAVIIVFLGYLLNENSALCIFKSDWGVPGSKCGSGPEAAGPGAMPGLTPEEQEILRRLKEKEARYAVKKEDGEGAEASAAAKPKKTLVETYRDFMGKFF